MRTANNQKSHSVGEKETDYSNPPRLPGKRGLLSWGGACEQGLRGVEASTGTDRLVNRHHSHIMEGLEFLPARDKENDSHFSRKKL